MKRAIWNANEDLELLNHYFSSQTDLLALLRSVNEKGAESQRGFLGQRLRCTQALVGRVVEPERAVALNEGVVGRRAHDFECSWRENGQVGKEQRD